MQDQSNTPVITMLEVGTDVYRTLVDNGARSTVFQKFRANGYLKNILTALRQATIGINGDPVDVLGHIVLIVELGDLHCQQTIVADLQYLIYLQL